MASPSVITIDCGGTHLGVGRAAGITLKDVRTVPAPDRLEDLIPAILDLTDPGGATAIGIAVAGLVDADRGRLLWMPHRGGGPIDLAATLGVETGLPVVVDNDANLAALAEAVAGAGTGYRMVLMVTVGTGIGGGLVIDGGIERGRGHLGEIGHLPVDRSGPRCGCGLFGCWETFASGKALDRVAGLLVDSDPGGPLAVRIVGRRPLGADLVEAAAGGDRAAAAAIDEVAAALGRGLGGLVAVFDPDVVVIGGGVGAIGEPVLGPARAAMASAIPGREHRRPTPVLGARFGVDAGLVGAAMAAASAR